MIDATISVIMITATSGATGRIRRVRVGTYRLSATPATTGRMTTWTVLISNPTTGTSTRLDASNAVKLGVMIAAPSVDTAVMVTESGTSARARKLITFDAVPPGHEAMRISPISERRGQVQQIADAPAQGRHDGELE